MHIILIIALLLLTYWYLKSDFDRTPLEYRRQWLTQKLGFALIIVLVLLAMTGRLHWLGALVGSVIPAIKMIYDTFKKRKSTEAPQQPQPQSSDLNREQALQILGFANDATPSEDEIKTAHKQLMQKLHPDRGGNDFLAAQLNAAKERLLS